MARCKTDMLSGLIRKSPLAPLCLSMTGKGLPKRGITISPFGKWGNKGDFVNCRSSISNIEKSGVRIRPQAPDFSPQIEEEEIEKSGV